MFVEVWRRAGDYDPERGSVASWLRVRMRSRALDRVRSPARRRSQPLEAASEPMHEADAERAADGASLRAALGELPSEQRAVLWLGYFEGLSSSEIAEREGIPLGTVKSRAAAAMAKLRAHLRASPGGAP